MYAVIKTGGKQYRVATDDVLTIEKVKGDAGAKIEFAEVLMIGGSLSADDVLDADLGQVLSVAALAA